MSTQYGEQVETQFEGGRAGEPDRSEWDMVLLSARLFLPLGVAAPASLVDIAEEEYSHQNGTTYFLLHLRIEQPTWETRQEAFDAALAQLAAVLRSADMPGALLDRLRGSLQVELVLVNGEGNAGIYIPPPIVQICADYGAALLVSASPGDLWVHARDGASGE